MTLHDTLSTVEQLLQQAAEALIAADPSTTEATATQVRDAVALLVPHMASLGDPARADTALRLRLQGVGRQLAALRDGLARVAATTERQVAVLVPARQDQATYGAAVGGARPSSAARLYRAAG